MKDNSVDILCQLEERAIKDIKKLLVKDDITPAEWDTAGKAVDIIKDIATTKAMKEEHYEEEDGYSSRSYRKNNSYGRYPDYDGYPRMFGNNRMSYMADGSNFNRSSNQSSYASEMNNVVANLKALMAQSSNDTERNTYARWIDEAERSSR